MADLLDKLNYDGEITYRRCGEVVVAPECNVFALYCILCEDIFLDVREFFRHVRREHDDEFEFESSQEQEIETYSIEELLNGISCKQIIADEELEWSRRAKLNDTEDIFSHFLEKRPTYTKFEEQFEQEISNSLKDVERKSESKKSKERYYRDLAENEDAMEGNALEDAAVQANALFDDAVGEDALGYKTHREKHAKEHAVHQTNGKENVEEDPGLEDLLNELSEELDCNDRNVFKKLTHNTLKNVDNEMDVPLVDEELPPETIGNLESLLEDEELINDLKLILKSEKESFADEYKHQSNRIETIQKVYMGENEANPIQFTKQYTNSLSTDFDKKHELYSSVVDNVNISKTNIKSSFTEPSKTSSKRVVKRSSSYSLSNVKLTKNLKGKNESCAIESNKGKDIPSIQNYQLKSINSRKPTQTTIGGLSKRPSTNSFCNVSSIKNVIFKRKSEVNARNADEENNQSSNGSNQQNYLCSNGMKKILEKPDAQKAAPNSNKLKSFMKDYLLNEKISPSEQNFNKKLKVRVKKLSPSSSPEEGHSNDLIYRNVNDNKSLNKKLDKQLTQSKMLSSTTENTQNNRNSFMTAETETLPMVTSPTAKTIFCKQNFTEQSLSAKIGASSKTGKQSNKITQLSASRQRKASIDVIQETPFCDNKEMNRSARKNQVLQRMSKIRKRITKIIDKENEICSREKNNSQPIDIRDVTILPPIPLEIISNYSEIESFNDFKKPISKTEKGNQKTQAAAMPSPLDKKIKVQQQLISKTVETNSKHKSEDVMDTTKLDLSESTFEFMAQDLCQDKIDVNQLDSILEPTPDDDVNVSTQKNDASSSTILLEDLLEQVDKEKLVTPQAENDTNRQNLSDVKSAHQEIELLDKIGLKIVMISEDELMPLHEEETLRSKAKQFAEVLRNHPFAWKNSCLPNNSPSLELCFVKMTKRINDDLELNFTTGDTKRILNLIICWYMKQCSNKLINKKVLSGTLKFYMELFSFLPKTGRPFLNCEFCDLQFRTEGTYFIHRCTHTGGYPYNCVNCGKGFKRQGSLKTHELSHTNTNKSQQNQKSKEINSTDHIDESPKKYIENYKTKLKRILSPETTIEENNPKRLRTDNCNYMCDVCGDVLKSSISLYRHKMLHLKRVYNCNICKKVLPTSVDLTKHMDTFHKNYINTAKKLSLRQKKD